MRPLTPAMLLLALSAAASVPGASLTPPRWAGPTNRRPARQSFGPAKAKGKAHTSNPTPDDLARIEAAEAKRLRKAKRK